jgi:hypothetical protein
MPALVVGAASAIAAERFAGPLIDRITFIPQPIRPIVKIAGGAGLVLLSTKVENGHMKAATVGVGVGLAADGLMDFLGLE